MPQGIYGCGIHNGSMDYQVFRDNVKAAAEAAGLKEFEIYYGSKEKIEVSIYQTEVRSFSGTTDNGVCFRCIKDGKMGYASTELFEEEEAENLVERAIDNALSIECEDEVFLHGQGDVYQEAAAVPKELPVAEKIISKALELQKQMYEADGRIADGTETQVSAVRETKSITNSKGLELSGSGYVVSAICIPLIHDGEESLDAGEFETGTLEEIDSGVLAKKSVSSVISQLGAGKVASGYYKVVFSADTMALLLKTFASVFSGEEAQRGLSLLGGKEGEKIASEQVTLMDNPLFPGSLMQSAFDDEGVAAYSKEVIKEGTLTTLLHNLKTAKKAGVKSTANAFKSSYSANVTVSPYCFYFKPGELGEEEVLEKTGDGIYIDDIQGTHSGANPQTGDFSLGAKGCRIQNGVKEKAVKGFTVAGNFYELLKNITVVGNNLKFGLPEGTVYGSPSILVENLSIAGE